MNNKSKHLYAILGSVCFAIMSLKFMLMNYPLVFDLGPILSGEKEFNHVQSGLESGVITVFTSSDLLLKNLKNTPTKFFLNTFGFQVNECYGRWVQSWGMEAKIVAHQTEKSIANAKMVLVITPEWFGDRYKGGNPLEYFFLNFGHRYMFEYLNNELTTANQKNKMERFVNEKSNFKFENKIQQLVDNYFLFPYIESNVTRAESSRNTLHYKFSKIDFTGLSVNAVKIEKLNKTNNPWEINDEYFSSRKKLMRPNGKIRQRKLFVEDSVKKDLERGRFLSLLSTLRKFKHKPLIIVSDLNRFFHVDKYEMNSTVSWIEREAKKNGFGVLNLWSYSDKESQFGILSDLFHLGELGWVKVNQSIIQHFGEEKK